MGQILHGSAKTTPGLKGGIKTSKLTLAVPVHMKDPGFASLAAPTERRWRGKSEKV